MAKPHAMTTTNNEFRSKARKVLRKLLWGGVVVLLLFGAGYYFTRTWTVSEGSRSGTLFKLASEGTVYRTLEGQLDVTGSTMLSQTAIWAFSIKDKNVYTELQKYEGKDIVVHYKELADPFPWQAKTKYIVYRVEPMQ